MYGMTNVLKWFHGEGTAHTLAVRGRSKVFVVLAEKISKQINLASAVKKANLMSRKYIISVVLTGGNAG